MENREWSKVQLGDLVTIKHGWPFKSEYFTEFQDSQPIVVNIGNFKYTGGFRFDSTTLKGYIGSYPKEFVLKPNDILLVMTCQTAGGEILGIPGCIPDDSRTYLHNQRMGKVVIKDPSRVDQAYLYWLFLSPELNRHLVVTASGTKILHTSPDRIEEFSFYLPSLSEQMAIANILDALENKIELNRQMNGTLEAVARVIFKSWFVDFDPVQAKMEGRELYGMDAEMAALFPDSFEDSELGEIPRGWKIGKVSELVSIRREALTPINYPEEIFEHYSIPAFDEGGVPKLETGIQIKSNKYVVPTDVILLSKMNPDIPRVWLPKVSGIYHSVCSTEFIVNEPKKGYTREYLYTLFYSNRFLDVFASLVTGSTGSHQRVTPDSMLNIDVIIPSKEVIVRFTEIARPIYEKRAQNLEESITIASIRNSLLPKLMSGEIRMKEAEKYAETHL